MKRDKKSDLSLKKISLRIGLIILLLLLALVFFMGMEFKDELAGI